MAIDDSTPGWSTKDRALVRTVTELLEAGQYKDLAELLDRVRSAYDREGDALPAHTLDLARRICLACSQSQAEADWHQQAREEAAQREEKLRHQLNTLLDLTGERNLISEPPAAMPGPPAPDLPAPAEPLSLRQRLQAMLRRRPDPQPPTRVAPEIPTEGAHRPPPVPAQAAEVAALPLVASEDGPVPVASAETETWEEPVSPSLVVYCLGAFRVYQDEHLLTDWEGLKAKCILKYLVTHHGTPIVKDVLMHIFWPDADPEAARRNLHQAVYSLRRVFRQRRPDLPYVLFENDSYLLNPDMPIWVDFEEFEKHVQHGQRLEAAGQDADAMKEYGVAEGLYEGDYLEEDPYEDWPQAQRQRLQSMYLQIANCLSKYYVRQREHTAVITLCRKILVLDSCYEEAHRRLMQCYLAQGQRHLAVRQYQACVQSLREELDLSPSERTVELYQRIPTGM